MYKFLNFYQILKSLRFYLKYILLLFFAFLLATVGFSQSRKNSKSETAKTTVSGTSLAKADTSKALKTDSLLADSTSKKPKRDIETTINYSAEDSIILDAETKTAFLYKDAKVEYGKMSLTANTIDMDYNTNQVNATFMTDSLGNKVGVPLFKEGSEQYEAGVIKYNYKTKRGQVKQIVTKQGDAVIRGKVVKKEPTNTMYVDGANYTTCDLREPHFCIKSMQIKVIPKKKIVTRAFNMQIDDVPTLLAFPFGVFPIPKRRGTGLIFPSYGESQQRGFFLSNLGFYWAISDYVGFKVLTDQYSIGGLGTGRYTGDLDYKSRYSFQGKANVSYSNLKDNPDNPLTYRESQQIWIRWNHSTLSKGTGKFNASVNAGSSNFNRNNEFNVQQRQNANFTSSINYSNALKKTPFSYSLSARQEQNIATGVMNFDLPQASLNMNRIYPLKTIPFISKAEPVKKFQFSYSSNFINKLTNVLVNVQPRTSGVPLYSLNPLYLTTANPNFREDSTAFSNYYKADTLNTNRFLNSFGANSRWTITHNVPISTTLKVFKYFNLTPNASYRETWYDKQYSYSYRRDSVPNDIVRKGFIVDTLRSFSRDGNLARKYEMNGGVSATTRIYGTFYIQKAGFEAVRHVIIPTVGFSYVPVFDNYFQRVDTGRGVPPVFFDRFTGARITDPSRRKDAANISFSIANTLEGKFVDKKDTSKTDKKFKKQMLLDAFGISGTYNLKADSFNLSNFVINARTKLFGIFDVNFNSQFDPYLYEDRGVNSVTGYNQFRRTRYFAWNDAQSGDDKSVNFRMGEQGFGRFVTMELTVGTRFAPKNKKSKKINPLVNGTDYQFMYNPAAPPYVDFSLPWTLNINYRLGYSRYNTTPAPVTIFNDRSTFRNNITLNGDVTAAPKWKLGYTTGYDVNTQQMTNTVFNVSRDLHCWYATLSTAVYPTTFQYFLVTVGIKSPTLADVKIPRRSAPFRDQ